LLLGKNAQLDVKELLRYSLGNVSFPLATDDGTLATTAKATFRNYLMKKYPSSVSQEPAKGGAAIIDGMAVVQSLSLRSLPPTFGDVARQIYNVCRGKAIQYDYNRVDIVFDNYPPLNIKALTQSKRAKGPAAVKRVIKNPQQPLPKNWKNYLSVSDNKVELIEFLFSQWVAYPPATFRVLVNHGQKCDEQLWHGNTERVEELCCDQTEADTIMILHTVHAGKDGGVTIISADTDVFMLGIAHSSVTTNNLNLLFGEGPNVYL
jgi:hypothetical protein